MQRRHRNRAFHMLAATIASHCNLNQYPLGDRCLWLRGRIVLPTLIIMAATATDGVRDSVGATMLWHGATILYLESHRYFAVRQWTVGGDYHA